MKYPLLLSIAFAILLGSCRKNHDTPAGPNAPGIRVKTETENNFTSTYAYDSQGRIISITKQNGAKMEFLYETGKITLSDYASNGSLDDIYTYALNAEGLASKVTSGNSGNTRQFYYNPDQTLAKEIVFGNGGGYTIDFFYTNGNIDSVRQVSNNQWVSTAIPTYLTDKPDMPNNETCGLAFLGKKNKNLFKSMTHHYADGGISTFELTYEFDEQGRVTKKTTQNGPTINSVQYSYY